MMPAPDISADASRPEDLPPGDLVTAGIYGSAEAGFDHSLVVLALGQVCWLLPSPAGYRLLVKPSVAARAQAELASYDRESAGWPPRVAPDVPALPRLELVTPLLWALVVMAVFRGQLHHPGWTEAGALDSAAVFERGEWWRAGTALFLHANREHLVSNLLAGVFAFATELSLFGRAHGWLLLGVAAVSGNLAVAAMHYPGPYVSLGASTAIFAALGLLTGRAVRIAIRAQHPHRGRLFFVPLAAGLTVLALYGTGSPQVDVLAHVAGFTAGAVLGFMAGRLAPAGLPGQNRA